MHTYRLAQAGICALVIWAGQSAPALANSIRLACDTGAFQTIVDGGVGDQNPAVDVVQHTFVCNEPDWTATVTLIGRTVPGLSATTILTDAVITNTTGNPVSDRIIFGQTFPAILPPNASTASLNGSFDDVSGALLIGSADIRFNPLVQAPATPIGLISPPAAVAVGPPVPFAGNSGPVPVDRNRPATSQLGFINFDLGTIGDTIRLPDSARITTFTTLLAMPEPGSIGLLLVGLLGLVTGSMAAATSHPSSRPGHSATRSRRRGLGDIVGDQILRE